MYKKVLSVTWLMRYRQNKDNILMTLQSSLGSKVTVIAGILVCIVVGLAYRPSICTMILNAVVSLYVMYFEKLTKLVTYRRYLK